MSYISNRISLKIHFIPTKKVVGKGGYDFVGLKIKRFLCLQSIANMGDTERSRKVSFSIWSSSQTIHDSGKPIVRRTRTKSDDGGIIYRGGIRLKENGDMYIKQLSKKQLKKNIKAIPKYVHWFRTYNNGLLEDICPTRNVERYTLDGVFYGI